MAVTRLIALDDAAALARLQTTNRAYLAPWSPLQEERYFTEEGQREVLERDLAGYERGGMFPMAILDDDGTVCGRINLNTIVRGGGTERERGLLGQRVPYRARPGQRRGG